MRKISVKNAQKKDQEVKNVRKQVFLQPAVPNHVYTSESTNYPFLTEINYLNHKDGDVSKNTSGNILIHGTKLKTFSPVHLVSK